MAPAPPGTLALQLALMRRVGERQATGEAAPVTTGDLAGVQDDRSQLALGDANLDAAAGERGIDRVIVAIDAQIGLLRHADDEPPIAIRQRGGQRPHPLALLREAFDGNGADRAMHPLVDLLAPAVE